MLISVAADGAATEQKGSLMETLGLMQQPATEATAEAISKAADESRRRNTFFVAITPAAAKWLDEITVWDDYPAAAEIPGISPDEVARRYRFTPLTCIEGRAAMQQLTDAVSTAAMIAEFDECAYGVGTRRSLNALLARCELALKANS